MEHRSHRKTFPEGAVDQTGFVSAPLQPRLRLAVGIATHDRPAVLMEALAKLRLQQRRPEMVLVSHANPGDLGNAPERFPEVTFLKSPLGLTRQRNTVLQALSQEDLLVFIDDDFYLREDYLQRVERAFVEHPEVVVATGCVLADGINGPGLTFAEAERVLERSPRTAESSVLSPVFNAYGCNMCLRLAPVQTHHLRFDENLPLYGWYEDVEFSRQMALFGEVVKVSNAFGVHLGIKSGRQSGVRLGYSQVANPLYLARGASVPWTYALASMLSRSAKNLVRSAWPEPFVDRRGRLKGNLRAWIELLNGKIDPRCVEQLGR